MPGPWDFAYLGDVPLAAGAFIREEEFQGTRLVPDAFNDRRAGGRTLRVDACGRVCGFPSGVETMLLFK